MKNRFTVWLSLTLLGLLLKFILSDIHVGEPTYIEAKIIKFGFGHGLTGKHIVYTARSSDGTDYTFEATFTEVIKMGDRVSIVMRERLLFLPDVYLFHEKLDSENDTNGL